MYGKMFRQMYHGTLATTGPWQAMVTFQQFIVLADSEGIVDMTAESISRETTIPLEIIQAGIVALEKPDPDSRTPDEDGRRIVLLSENRRWGWKITNYLHYRQLKREEDRREYHRQYWHTRKLKQLNTAQHTQPSQPIAEAEAYAKGKKREGSQARHAKPPPRKRCPEAFEITQDLRTWASTHAPDVDISQETEKFRDWEFKTGRSDWPATWRTWMRRAQESAKPKNGNGAANSLAVTAWNALISSDGAQRDDRAQQALEKIGGWQRIRMRTAFDAERIRSEFCKTYEEIRV